MCDTLVALGNATADGSVLFAKNSDREPNEAHELIIVPHALHPVGSQVRCTHVQIPQVEETFAVLLAKPFWIWGAEIGSNEHGVVIGNEAVFTKVPYEKGPGLVGMDFLRLGLERGATARAALDVITSLLETHGQGGNCGFTHRLYYHNSFIIADPREAWVLETAGRQWAAVQVQDVYNISNIITIGGEWDLASAGLVDYAIERGWCKNRDDFDFSRCYSDFWYTRFGEGFSRQCRVTDLLSARRGGITAANMMAYLRDHGSDAKPNWTPTLGLTNSDICMHAGFGPVRNGQSVGSMVSRLTPETQTHWLTGTSAPCTSIFKPVWLDGGLPDIGLTPQGKHDSATIWWQHENLHRAVLRDYATRIGVYQAERDALESEFVRAEQEMRTRSAAERAAFTAHCFASAAEAESGWLERVQAAPVSKNLPVLFKAAWKKHNKQAKLP
ncbi:MAG: C69 family dipeptidase [Anaerolineales bacterium]